MVCHGGDRVSAVQGGENTSDFTADRGVSWNVTLCRHPGRSLEFVLGPITSAGQVARGDRPITGNIVNRRIPFSFLIFASTRQRLWLGAVGMLLFVATIIVGNGFAAPEKALSRSFVGLDFSAFYTAGTFVREGRYASLYDLEAIRGFQRTLAATHGLELTEAIGPWWNPPFYAWVFASLSQLPYPDALLGWMGINALCAIAAALLLGHVLVADVLRTWRISGDTDDDAPEPLTPRPDTSWRTWSLVPLLLMVSMPFIGTIGHGQNGGTSLLLLTLVVMAWRAEQSMLAGLACGLLFYKPQLAAVVAGVLVMSMGIKAALGLACSGVGLIVLTLTTLPGTLAEFVTRMPVNLQRAQETLPYLWERHVTALSFWRLLIQGKAVGATSGFVSLLAIQCAVVLGGALVFLAIRAWKRHSRLEGMSLLDQRLLRQIQLDRLISATILSTPLIMPFYFDYDLILLAIPATLMARDVIIRRARGADVGGEGKINLRLWTMAFVAMMIGVHLATWTRVNVVVPLLGVLAMVAIGRAWKRVVFERQAIQVVTATPVMVRRAA
jgi:hypothetical protein